MNSVNLNSNSCNDVSLGWISQEINLCLVQARQYLEAFQDYGDADDLEGSRKQIHQLRNTLIVINLYGASMLADEIEAVLLFLQKQKTQGKADDILRAISSGILSLQDYLERIEKGAPDVPVMLLPVLNELRASRQKTLLSESAFFSPRLKEIVDRELAMPFEQNDALRDYIAANRTSFHRGLLKWYQDSDASSGLSMIREVLEGASRVAAPPVSRLFLLGAELAGVIWGHPDESSGATKLVIGQFDGIFRQIMTAGEKGLRNNYPLERLRNLLFYIGRSSSQTPDILRLKEEYSLGSEMALGTHGDSSSHVPSPGTIDAVSEALTSDITELKDALDIYNRSLNKDNRILESLVPRLRQVADTVGMLGLGTYRQSLQGHIEVINGSLTSNAAVEANSLDELASDLLLVELALPDLFHARPEEDAKGDTLAIGEVHQYTRETVEEMLTEIARIKDIISKALKNGQHELLADVPPLLGRVAGVMQVIKLGELKNLTRDITTYIKNTLKHKRSPIDDQEKIDKLADIISGIEYYLEVAPYQCKQEREILDYVSSSLTQLSMPVPETASSDAASEAMPQEEVVEEKVSPEASSSGEEPSADQHEAEQPATVTKQVSDNLIDDEIREIFRQEAEEQLDAITEFYPLWKKDHDNDEALQTVRRAFHTLKGSGRTVGASLIGEFSWELENLFNHIIDGIVKPGTQVLALIDRAVAFLPQLLENEQQASVTERENIERQAREVVASVFDSPRVEQAVKQPSGEVEQRQEFINDALMRLNKVLGYFKDYQASMHESDESLLRDAFREFHARIDANVDEDIRELTNKGKDLLASGQPIGDLAQPLLDHLSLLDKTLGAKLQATDASQADDDLQQALTRAGEMKQQSSQALEELRTLAAAGSGILEKETVETAEPGVQAPETVAADEIGGETASAEEQAPETAEPGAQVPETVAADEIGGETTPAEEQAPETVETEAEPPETVAADEIGGETTPTEEQTPETAEPEMQAPEPSPPAEEPQDELLPIFLEEARELNENIEGVFSRVSGKEGFSPEAVIELKRLLHTLKGAARLTGNDRLGDVTHAFEAMLISAENENRTGEYALYRHSRKAADFLHQQIESLEKGEAPGDSDEILAELEAALAERPSAEERPSEAQRTGKTASDDLARAEGQQEVETPAPGEAEVSEEKRAGPAREDDEAGLEPEIPMDTAREAASDEGKISADIVAFPRRRQLVRGEDPNKRVRVSTAILDKLVDGVGEVITFGSRLQQQRNNISANISEFEQTLKRLREQLRSLEIEAETQILSHYQRDGEYRGEEDFDPLELDQYSAIQEQSRALAETINDLGNISSGFDQAQHEIDMLLSQHSRLTSDLQDVLLHTRTVPFSQHVARLTRLVRQTCASTGKRANLRIIGEEEEMDRSILDRTIPLVEHLLRNAVYHGIESPAERAAMGKNEQGQIYLTLAREGMEIVLTLSDDGSGFNREAIRKRAIQKELISESDELNDEDILRLATLPGFSTADTVDQISGRGVGLDIVVNEIENLGGRLNIESVENLGSRFTIRFPFNIAITDALMVLQQGAWYAIPSASIDTVVRVTRNELESCYAGKREGYGYNGKLYRVKSLADYFGQEYVAPSETEKWHSLLLVSSGDRHIALHPEEVHGHNQIVLKSVGPQLESVPWIIGGTVKGDGNAALVIDPAGLISMDKVAREEAAIEQPVEDLPLTVMVVDDSITMRKVTGSMLERNGYNILTAKDGVDALAVIDTNRPDIILLDIEMPRMDGFEFARHLRNDERFHDIPIIMVTSRTGEKHRERAMELAIETYLGKPFQEDELLESIAELVGDKGHRA